MSDPSGALRLITLDAHFLAVEQILVELFDDRRSMIGAS